MIADDLLIRYNEILSQPVYRNSCISGECVSNLCETSWIKMMVVRYQVAPNITSIEIEISLPSCTIEIEYPSTEESQEQARDYIQKTLDHMNYLLKLQEIGFSLGIISTEGIWSAVLKVRGPPDINLFEKILPPE